MTCRWVGDGSGREVWGEQLRGKKGAVLGRGSTGFTNSACVAYLANDEGANSMSGVSWVASPLKK